MKEKINTKEVYLKEAMKLFAAKGYEAVGVVELAKAVGCTTSALYKHFSGKKALFDAILETAKSMFALNMQKLHLVYQGTDEQRARLRALTEDDLVKMGFGLFDSLTKNEMPALFRKLMTVEQFKNKELSEIYDRHYVKGQVDSFTQFSKVLIEEGIYKPYDPEIVAMEFVFPFTTFVSMWDRNPEDEPHIRMLLEKHIRQFDRIYRK